jgi:hypothetical protein
VPEKFIHIGPDLLEDEKDSLIAFLHKNQDVFAWSANDLHGVSRNLAQHNLNVTKGEKPRKQKLRKMSVERAERRKQKYRDY